MGHEQLEASGESDWDIGFRLIADAVISMDVPWQGFLYL